MVNLEVFHQVISSNISLLFLKSDDTYHERTSLHIYNNKINIYFYIPPWIVVALYVHGNGPQITIIDNTTTTALEPIFPSSFP